MLSLRSSTIAALRAIRSSRIFPTSFPATAASATAMPARAASSHNWLQRQARDPYVKAAAASDLRSRASFKLKELNSAYRIIQRGDAVIDLGAAPGGWSVVAAQLAAASSLSHTSASDPSPLAAAVAALPPAPRRRTSVLHAYECEPGLAPLPPPAVALPPPPPSPSPAAAIPTTRRGIVVAVDLLPMDGVPGVHVIRGDFMQAGVQAEVSAALAAHGRGACDVVVSDMSHAFTGEGNTDHIRQMGLAWCALAFACKVLKPHGHLLVKVRYGDEYAPFRAAVRRRFVKTAETKPPASRQESAEAYIVGINMRSSARGVSTEERALTDAHGIVWPT